ncbi:GrpE protein-like protein, mitochondrial [Scheffersomyces coipomensis]|uniref:GrpE protein-like protein, mitochondrial n=1 Tax=Scheffersomyces coipomensis TaxID=1788519 RepID=UPI00315CFC93
MHRAIVTPLLRNAAIRSAAPRTLRVMRQTPVVFPKQMIRFASTESNAKATESEAAKASETVKEAEPQAETEATEGNEVDTVEDLKAKLDAKDKDLANMKNHYARAIADFRNLQDTTKKEVQKAKDFALQKFAKDLLESLDNFSLALESVKEDTLKANEDVKSLYEGVSMTRNIFEKTLSKHGIEKIDPMGEQFDPNQHEATFQIPHPDKEPGTVFHVQQPGYTLNSRVLRPAKVGLVKGNEEN